MSILSQGIGLVRHYWRLVLFPAGYAAALWGNARWTHATVPDRVASLVCFIGGLLLMRRSARYWRPATLPGLRAEISERLSARWQSPRWVQTRGNFRILLWGVAVAVVALYGWRLLVHLDTTRPVRYLDDVQNLMVIWGVFPLLARAAEPEDVPLVRLHGRITRAAITRTVSNAAGISMVGAMVYTAVLLRYPAAVVTVAVTLGVAVIVSVHKTWTRTRKLCTLVHADVQTLVRDLEEFAEGPGEAKLAAAVRSWDAVHRDLLTRIDSGYWLFGMPFLPPGTVTVLEVKVARALDEIPSNKHAGADVLADFDTILTVCAARIDTVA
ncbi:hypothetical protein [Streptomyces flavofungini]|uniref:hypothetical protein n=1 Tax=Streptomyces flavofungini TaxID=68200 RepID=UPI0034DFF94D